MIAMLGVLLEENDVREEEAGIERPGDGTEILINRVQVYAAVRIPPSTLPVTIIYQACLFFLLLAHLSTDNRTDPNTPVTSHFAP
jgi:hypothetical protein